MNTQQKVSTVLQKVLSFKKNTLALGNKNSANSRAVSNHLQSNEYHNAFKKTKKKKM